MAEQPTLVTAPDAPVEPPRIVRAREVIALLAGDPWASARLRPALTGSPLGREAHPDHQGSTPDLWVLRDWLSDRGHHVDDLVLTLRAAVGTRVWSGKRRWLHGRKPRAPGELVWTPYSDVTKALTQSALWGDRYRELLLAGDLVTGRIARIHRQIWTRRALDARRRDRLAQPGGLRYRPIARASHPNCTWPTCACPFVADNSGTCLAEVAP